MFPDSGGLLLGFTQRYLAIFGTVGKTPVLAKEWDNLLILDGCRYEMYDRCHDLPGTLSVRNSLGSTTDEFVKKNFTGRELRDTVYVTANPRVNLALDGDEFHDVVSVWRTDWNEDLSTVRPEAVVDATKRVFRDYPEKRIIAHFIQPHAPFIGDFAKRELREHSTLPDHLPEGNSASAIDNIWTQLREGKVNIDTVRRAYDENLEVVIYAVKRLLEVLNGRTVITSDHGNLLGERVPPFMLRMYGHPKGIYTRPLVEVPWHVVDGDRRAVTKELPKDNESVQLTDDVAEKLADLGYT